MTVLEKMSKDTMSKDTRTVAKLPKSYTCQNCGERHRMTIYEQADFDEIGKRITMCSICGWLTFWQREVEE